ASRGETQGESLSSTARGAPDEHSLARGLSHRQARPLSKEIMTRELSMAGKIQTDILPEKTPEIPGWEFAAILDPARETSGDFYDFIPLANGNWGLVIADVTDKGMGAALFMALSSTLIRTYAARYPTLPALTMDVVNERLLTDTRGSMYITAIYGVLEPSIGRLRYVNAGHNPAYLLHTQKGKQVDRLSRTGMTLGVMEKTHWQQKIARLSAGDLLLLYTDGITEAQNPQGSFFGDQRLLEVLRSKSEASAGEIQKSILNEVHNFVGDYPQQDDIAMIVVRRKK
ncbi:MAG TPA: PP2C family protein-serine/threonine phosphatase, partial [Anaerolineales bacterium]